MINFILSYLIFIIYRNTKNRSLLLLFTEPLLVYSDENRLIPLFIFNLFLMNYIDLLHCNGNPDKNAIREFGVMISFFLRLGFFIYTIYYGEHIRNILYAIYLIILCHIDWDECNGIKKYNIIDYFSRLIFLVTYSEISFNFDIIMIPFSLLISGI